MTLLQAMLYNNCTLVHTVTATTQDRREMLRIAALSAEMNKVQHFTSINIFEVNSNGTPAQDTPTPAP